MSVPLQEISASQLLAKLETEAAAALQAIAGIRAALGLPPWSGPSGAPLASSADTSRESAVGVIRPDEFFRMSVPDAIKKYLSIMRKPQSPKAIAEGLKAGGILSNASDFYANITTAIKRLDAAGFVANTPNGWGLSEWYPSRPKVAESPRKAKGKKRHPKGMSPKSTTTNVQGLSDYQLFVREARKAGKDLKQISEEWRARKSSIPISNRPLSHDKDPQA